jgi:uncharacterized protein involved in exopolysaccharide biosynthesis
MGMDDLRGRMSEMANAEGLTFSDDEKHDFEEKLNNTRAELEAVRRKIQFKEEALSAERQALEDGALSSVPREVDSSYGDLGVIIQHRVKLAALKGERDAMATQFTENYPPLASLNSQITAMENAIRDELRSKIYLDEMDLRLLKSKEQDLMGIILSTGETLATIADREGKYNQMRLDLETLRDRYKELRQAQIKTKLSQATSPAWRVTLITPASRPFARKTKDYVRMALAPIFSVVVGLGLIFFVESLDHSIKSSNDAEEALGLPVLATLWEMKKRTF